MSATANDAAALAGIAQNRAFSKDDRLAASKSALDFYVAQSDKLRELVDELRRDAELEWPLADAAVRLEQILDGT